MESPTRLVSALTERKDLDFTEQLWILLKGWLPWLFFEIYQRSFSGTMQKWLCKIFCCFSGNVGYCRRLPALFQIQMLYECHSQLFSEIGQEPFWVTRFWATGLASTEAEPLIPIYYYFFFFVEPILTWQSCAETSTLGQRKGRAPQPSITFSCQARGVVVVGGGVPVVVGGSSSGGGGGGGGGPPRQRRHIHDSNRPIQLTVALGLKKKKGFCLERIAFDFDASWPPCCDSHLSSGKVS